MRTDADCRPAPNWVATGRRLLTGKVEMLCGKSEMRRDERPNLIERSVLPTLTWIALHVANLRLRVSRLHNADAKPDRYFFVHGHNIAMTADLYLRCGGFPRERMIDGVDDTQLMNRVRLHSNNIVRTEEMVVEHSLRRERAWGLRRTILWQLNRRWSPATDDELHVR
jgi:GT2 family glycosyltransferase